MPEPQAGPSNAFQACPQQCSAKRYTVANPQRADGAVLEIEGSKPIGQRVSEQGQQRTE